MTAIGVRRRARLLGGMSIVLAALVAGQAVTAVASPSPSRGWRIIFSHHYPRPRNAFSGYESVVVTGRHSAWAFGGTDVDSGQTTSSNGQPVAESWNGRTWRVRSLPAHLGSYIIAAGASSAANVWAVSYLGLYALHWNGKTWSTRRFSAALSGVSVISPDDVWVFGNVAPFGGAGTWHLLNGRWTKISGIGSAIETASAVSASDIWAIGQTGPNEASILRYDGHAWRADHAPALADFAYGAILAESARDVWIAGGTKVSGRFTPGLLHWNGVRWHESALPKGDDNVGQISPDGAGGLWLIVHHYQPDKVDMLHLSATGRATTTLLGPGQETVMHVARLPGTTAMLGAGSVGQSNLNAVIWAFGSVG